MPGATQIRRRGPVPVLPVLTVALGALLIGLAHKVPCHDGIPHEGEPWASACYSDILPLYGGRGLSEGLVPYLQGDVEYPVLTGAFMAAVGLPVHWLGSQGLLGGVDEGLVFYWATAAILVVLALVTVWAVAMMRRDRPWDAVMLAVAPAAVLAAGINWDLLAVMLTTLALLALARGRPVPAGVLFGLAVSAKFYPLVILGPIVLLALRSGTASARAGLLRLLGGAAGAWVAVNAPVAIAAPHGWARFYTFSSERGVDWGSAWFILDNLAVGESAPSRLGARLVGDIPLLNAVSQGALLLCCLGIAVLVLRAPRPPRVAAVAFLVVAAFLLTNKVWSPQFVLWLTPLAVLARPRWQFFLVWQAAEVVYLVTVFRSFLGDPGLGYALDVAAILRWLSVAALAGLVVAEAVRPELDVVRTGADGRDPDAGVLAAA